MDGTPVPQAPVTVSLEDLRAENVSFDTLEQAFGPSSLGILLVSNLPTTFLPLRHQLLSYASHLANLPSTELDKLTCPTASYLVGWSRGKETLKSGHYDTHKGSYYVNCAFYHDRSLQNAPATDIPSFPEYTAPNIWPPETALLAGFRATFEELCRLIIDTAALVARACDRYAVANLEGYEGGYLERVVRGSLTTKARLLHYYPSGRSGRDSSAAGGGAAAAARKGGDDEDDEDDDDWCATHLDHGCLTGLTSAMYVDETTTNPNPNSAPTPPPSTSTSSALLLPELPNPPSPDTGLYIHSRTNTVTKIDIPRDCLAFQTGEALQLITRGRFRAVPHFVRGERGGRVARNTLAVFTQPNLGEVVDAERGLTFAEFAREVVGRGV